MKTLTLLAVLALLTGCSDSESETEPEFRPTPSVSTVLTAPLELREHVLDQLEEQKRLARERKELVD